MERVVSKIDHMRSSLGQSPSQSQEPIWNQASPESELLKASVAAEGPGTRPGITRAVVCLACCPPRRGRQVAGDSSNSPLELRPLNAPPGGRLHAPRGAARPGCGHTTSGVGCEGGIGSWCLTLLVVSKGGQCRVERVLAW